jgi:uncharacterized cupin superfamily protein
MKTIAVAVLAMTIGFAGSLAAQGQAPPSKPPAGQPPAVQPPAGQPPAAQKPTPPRPRPGATRLSLTVFVTDPTGAPIGGAKVSADGPIVREGATSREGSVIFQGLRAGQYRLRFEADRFVLFERELTLRASEEIEVSLTRAPAPPKPPEPPPQAKPAPASDEEPGTAPDPNARVSVVSLPDFIEKNKIAAEGSGVGSAPGGGSYVLEVDQSKDRLHPDRDEFVYVIAGQGTLRSKGRDQALEAGMLVLVPRGVAYTIAPRGRKAMYALSVLTGKPR